MDFDFCLSGNRTGPARADRTSVLLPRQGRFSGAREKIVGPGFFLWAGRRGTGRGWLADPGTGTDRIGLFHTFPVFGRIRDPPYVPLRVERGSDQKILAIGTQRNTVRHPRRNTRSTWQIAEQNGGFGLQLLGGSEAASGCADHQQRTSFAKRVPAIEADDADGNLHTHSRASARGF